MSDCHIFLYRFHRATAEPRFAGDPAPLRHTGGHGVDDGFVTFDLMPQTQLPQMLPTRHPPLPEIHRTVLPAGAEREGDVIRGSESPYAFFVHQK